MKKFSFLIVMLALVLGGVGAWWINGTAPADPSNASQKNFSITKGEGVRQVANNLKTEGLIKDPVVFFLFLKQQGLDAKIQAGEFLLSPSMSASEIAGALQAATNDIRVTIPEGKRAEEVADILEQYLPNYNESWRAQLIAQEGYLFPDTYSFPKDADIDLVISTMTGNFEEKYASIPAGRNSNAYSRADIVKIASLVEREAKNDEDRPIVASVILNRLSSGMSLDIDASVQYAIGTPAKWWPTLEDYARNIAPDSPYNTYNNPGLPPTPISNPGIAVLQAVINAPDTEYVYYITDQNGVNRYGRTLDEHNANIERYGL
jgi:UPF0755 protein